MPVPVPVPAPAASASSSTAVPLPAASIPAAPPVQQSFLLQSLAPGPSRKRPGEVLEESVSGKTKKSV